MDQVLIRNAPDETIETYKKRAKAKRRSLEAEPRELLEAGKSFTPQDRSAAARSIRDRTKDHSLSLSLDEVREGLE